MVELPCLLLAKAVKGLILRAGETHRGAIGFLPFHFQGLESGLSVHRQRGSVGLVESHRGRGLVHYNGKGRCAHTHLLPLLRYGNRFLAGLLGHYRQAGPVPELLLRRLGDPDDVRSDDLQPYGLSLARNRYGMVVHI